MKRSLVYCSFLCAMMFGIVAVSAAPTDFSGTWVRDNAKSQGVAGRGGQAAEVTLMVKQDDKTLTVETKTVGGDGQERVQTATYNLDGSETTAEAGGRMPGKVTSKAKWMNDGKTLEIHSVRNISRDGNEFTITTKSHWELAEGGKVLKVHSVTETPQGDRESTSVYNKK
ncbi:MAG: hypothetical protein L0229_31825 [Blastocatellia bacterium]|nr:hypothetical protein [Blastocatellia bacterium]